jgi:hypothetical protein
MSGEDTLWREESDTAQRCNGYLDGGNLWKHRCRRTCGGGMKEGWVGGKDKVLSGAHGKTKDGT